MKKLLTSFVLILTAVALTGCGSASKTMARNLDNTITNLVYSVSNLDVLDNATISQIKSLNNNQNTAQAALCFLAENNGNKFIETNGACPECCQTDKNNKENLNNTSPTDTSADTTIINKNRVIKNAISGSNIENINKFSQDDFKNADFVNEHPFATTHPGARKNVTTYTDNGDSDCCQNNQQNCDNCTNNQDNCCNENKHLNSFNSQNNCNNYNNNTCDNYDDCNQGAYSNCDNCNQDGCENCKPICNKPINIDPDFSVGNPTPNTNGNTNNSDSNNINNINGGANNTQNGATTNETINNLGVSNSPTNPNNDQTNNANKNNSIGINSENIADGDANKILNQTGITTGGNDIDTSTSTNSIYSDLATSSARISELIADLVKVRTVIMLYISDLYNGSITLSQDEINAINSYANIIKESTAYLKSNQGTVKNHLNEATNFCETDAYASLANSHIIRATEVLNTRGAKIESAVVATMNIIEILKTNVENAKSQLTNGGSNGASSNSVSNTAGGLNGQNANTSQILEGNVANASFEGSGLFGGGSPNYTMNNPYNMGVNGQNYGVGAYPFGTGIGGGLNYGAGVGGNVGAYPFGFGANAGTGMINGAVYPYGLGTNGGIMYPYGLGAGMSYGAGMGIGGIGGYPYGAEIGAYPYYGAGMGTYPYGMGVAGGTGIANGMGGFGYPIAGEIVEGNGGIIGEVGIGGAGLAGNGIIGNGSGVAGGVGVGGVVNSGVGNTNINGGAMPNVLTGLVSSDDQQPLTDAQTDTNTNAANNNANSDSNNNDINNNTNDSSNSKTQTEVQPLANTNTQQCDKQIIDHIDEGVACTAQPHTKNANKKNVRTYTPNPLFGATVNKKSFYDLATQDYINTSSTAHESIPATKSNIVISNNNNRTYTARQLPNSNRHSLAARLSSSNSSNPDTQLNNKCHDHPAARLSNANNQFPTEQLSNADNQFPTEQLSNADNQFSATQLSNKDNKYPAVQLPNGDESYPITTLPDTSQRRPVVTI